MDDETLLNISLIVTIIGLLLLMAISYAKVIPEYNIGDITSSDIGQRIKVKGIIKSSSTTNSTTSLTLQSECMMNVFIDRKQEYYRNSNATITGIVEEYNGKINIRAEKVEINAP